MSSFCVSPTNTCSVMRNYSALSTACFGACSWKMFNLTEMLTLATHCFLIDVGEGWDKQPKDQPWSHPVWSKVEQGQWLRRNESLLFLRQNRNQLVYSAMFHIISICMLCTWSFTHTASSKSHTQSVTLRFSKKKKKKSKREIPNPHSFSLLIEGWRGFSSDSNQRDREGNR